MPPAFVMQHTRLNKRNKRGRKEKGGKKKRRKKEMERKCSHINYRVITFSSCSYIRYYLYISYYFLFKI